MSSCFQTFLSFKLSQVGQLTCGHMSGKIGPSLVLQRRHLNVWLYRARFLPDSERKSTAVGSRRQQRIKIQKHYVIARCYTTQSLTTIRRVWRCRRRSENASRLRGTAAGLNLSTHLTHLFTCCDRRECCVLTETKLSSSFEFDIVVNQEFRLRGKKKKPKKTAHSAASVVLMSL